MNFFDKNGYVTEKSVHPFGTTAGVIRVNRVNEYSALLMSHALPLCNAADSLAKSAISPGTYPYCTVDGSLDEPAIVPTPGLDSPHMAHLLSPRFFLQSNGSRIEPEQSKQLCTAQQLPTELAEFHNSNMYTAQQLPTEEGSQ